MTSLCVTCWLVHSAFFFACVLSPLVVSDSVQPYGLLLPNSSVHGTSQVRIRGWVVMLSSRGSCQPRGRACVSCPLHWQAGSSALVLPGKLLCALCTFKCELIFGVGLRECGRPGQGVPSGRTCVCICQAPQCCWSGGLCLHVSAQSLRSEQHNKKPPCRKAQLGWQIPGKTGSWEGGLPNREAGKGILWGAQVH